jgi:ADP-ribose pyrophosphatase YjhB (NUDIX family)
VIKSVHLDLRAHISALESTLGDARLGLPEEVFRFVSRITPLINVDLLIQDDHSRTLLTWRDDEFYGPGWHVPGGIIRYKESSADRLRACAREELGADVAFEPGPLLVAESIRGKKTRGHHISLLFRCRLLSPPDEAKRAASDRPSSGQWRWHERCPPDLLEAQHEYARFF